MNIAERLERLSMPEPNSGCRIWTGYADRLGYGHITCDKESRLAHIVAWEQAKGPVQKGLELDHRCKVRCCIELRHLEPVTHSVNVLRGKSPAQLAEWNRTNRTKTFCDKCGSPYEVMATDRGRPVRRCRRCTLALARANYARRKAQ